VPLRNIANNHCEIIVCRGRLRLRDLGSEFGTFVNGERISETLLRKSDSIRLGPVTFVVRNGRHERHNGTPAPHNGSEPATPSVSLESLRRAASNAQPASQPVEPDREVV
jgi:pSer/pThr/pTyr-binding forkhead associated (FHA) protein